MGIPNDPSRQNIRRIITDKNAPAPSRKHNSHPLLHPDFHPQAGAFL
jgi:hypothetical protein